MQKKFAMLMILLVGAASMSGCLDGIFGGSGGTVVIAKKVLVDPTSDGTSYRTFSYHAEPPTPIFEEHEVAMFAGWDDFVSVTMEYVHQGGPVDPAALQATFRVAGGAEWTEPLSRYTDRDVLRAGNVVQIRGVDLTSGLVVKQGDTVIAERAPLEVEWFSADGHPIPVRASREGTAKYEVKGKSAFELSIRDLRERSGEFDIEAFDIKYAVDTTGAVDMATTMLAGGPRIEFNSNAKLGVSLFIDTRGMEHGERLRFGADAKVEARSDQRSVLIFDNAGSLRTYGSGLGVWADGDIEVWDEDHPRGSNWRPEDLPSPLIDERIAYREEHITTGMGSDSDYVEFLSRLWSAKIGLGDEYVFRAVTEMDDDSTMRFEVRIQVSGEERRRVPAGTFETYRVEQVMELIVTDGSGQSTRIDARFNHWVDRTSGLLVAAQGKTYKTLDWTEVNRLLFSVLGENLDAPKKFSIVLSEDTDIRLMQKSGDLQTAPFLGLAGAGGPLVSLGPTVAGSSLFPIMGFGEQDMEAYDYEHDSESWYDDYDW